MHVFAEEGLRNFFDIIAITYEKGAKSSLYRALPDITSNRHYIGSPPCQQISSSFYRPFRYSGPRYIGPPTVININRYITYHTLVGYRMYNRSFFPRSLRMSVSYSEGGAYVPTFGRFRIALRRRRSHEPSSGPPCRPSPGAARVQEANDKIRL